MNAETEILPSGFHNQALIQEIAWCRFGTKPFFKSMINVVLYRHRYVWPGPVLIKQLQSDHRKY